MGCMSSFLKYINDTGSQLLHAGPSTVLAAARCPLAWYLPLVVSDGRVDVLLQQLLGLHFMDAKFLQQLSNLLAFQRLQAAQQIGEHNADVFVQGWESSLECQMKIGDGKTGLATSQITTSHILLEIRQFFVDQQTVIRLCFFKFCRFALLFMTVNTDTALVPFRGLI